jgi:hypothetical protein
MFVLKLSYCVGGIFISRSISFSKVSTHIFYVLICGLINRWLDWRMNKWALGWMNGWNDSLVSIFVFWAVTPCKLAFRRNTCLHIQPWKWREYFPLKDWLATYLQVHMTLQPQRLTSISSTPSESQTSLDELLHRWVGERVCYKQTNAALVLTALTHMQGQNW